MPISTGNENDGFAALVNGKMVVLRIPYPIGFYAKGLDARIDDPHAGWKGSGLWSSEGDRTPWLKEGGKGDSRSWSTSRSAPTRWRTERASGWASLRAAHPCNGKTDYRRRVRQGMLCRGRPSAVDNSRW